MTVARANRLRLTRYKPGVHVCKSPCSQKSLLALAALGAFAGAASAQSSVTLYGRVDTAVVYSTAGDNVTNGDSTLRLDDGGDRVGIGGSRWGLRGVEDIGGGNTVFFQLESGLRSDTGAAADNARLFNRTALVGLRSKTLGALSLGRQETLTRRTNALADVTGLGELKVDESNTGGIVYETLGQRIDNSVLYETPNFSGFVAQVLVAAGEATVARQNGVRVSYTNGPIALAAAYERREEFNGQDAQDKVATLAGSYNFGVAKLHLGYQKVSDVTAPNVIVAGNVEDRSGYNIGVSVPLGKATINAQYQSVENERLGASDVDMQKYGISVRYALSKRTTLYSAFTQRSGDVKDNLAAEREITLFGLAHTF